MAVEMQSSPDSRMFFNLYDRQCKFMLLTSDMD